MTSMPESSMENLKRPPKPRPAATVVLLREREERLEVYLLKRSPESPFFPGNYVFPGGTVMTEDGDADFWKSHVDLAPAQMKARWGGGQEESLLAFGVSAIRETFEEAGVFLGFAGEGAGGWETVCRSRTRERLHKGWLREQALQEAWVLGLSQLAPWSHWVTPEAMPRRFDTRFFVAFMPSGQNCSPDHRETTHGAWVNPRGALEGNLRKEMPLSPPTLVTLHGLLPYSNRTEVETALKGRTWGEPLLPRFMHLSCGAMIVEPWDPMYSEDIDVDATRLEEKIPDIGKSFSRIWYHDGVWRPVLS